MFRDKIIESHLYKEGAKRGGAIIPGYKTEPDKLRRVEISVYSSVINIFVDGKEVSSARYSGLIPTEKISFRTYNCEW